MRQTERRGLRAPALILDVDRSTPNPAKDAPLAVQQYNTLWYLSRDRGIPTSISYWDIAGETHLTLADISESNSTIERAALNAGYTHLHDQVASDMTVVICTRDRPAGLRRVLSSLQRQSDSDFAVLVMDNAPTSSQTAAVVTDMDMKRCQYLVEPRPGLSRARNSALNKVQTEFVAWIDDGEIADTDWIFRLKQGFAHECQPVAVCGLICPAELETEAQVRFEQYNGFNKGRGISPEVLLAGSAAVPNTLYPLPAIGAGGNMAFRVSALRAVGPFDPNLGAGTRTHGGEETRVLASLLRAGHAVLYWPAAITWHFHRREMTELRKQIFGYSAGLTAFYASMVRSDPAVLIELLQLIPQAFRDPRLRGAVDRVEELPNDFPKSLSSARRRGLLEGAFLYTFEALKNRREYVRG